MMIFKKSKIYIAFALAVAAVMSLLVACDNKTPDGGHEDPPDKPTVTYTVSFDANGGTAQKSMTYTVGGAALFLPTPINYGNEFVGWYDNAELSGTAVNAAAYAPTADVTLYAKWDKVTYLYMYYGEKDLESKRISYHKGDVITLAELTPPEPYVVDGITCPFIGWKYENNTYPPASITVGDDNIILLAMYDTTALPAKHHFTQNADGTITATGNLAWVQTQATSNIGVYSVEVAFSKGAGGGAGVAFRMDMSHNDYPYQDAGTNYLSAVLIPASGRLQVASVTDGAFAHMAGSVVAFNAMPEAWQQKYDAATNDVKATLTVVDYGDKFEIYIDGEKTFTFTDSAYLAPYTGTGFGVRCSSSGSDFGKFAYHGALTVSFEPNGGTACEETEWLFGRIELPVPTKTGVVVEGWYYDEALTQKVDPDDFKATDDVKLYANWTDDYIPVHIETFGGTVIPDVNYTGGAISLPTPTRVNSFFTGWFYDEACTQAVDLTAPEIEEETTIYAKYRLPYGHVTDNGDGTYTTQDKSTFTINALADSLCGIYEMDLTFPKGISGAVGLAFRGTAFRDYAWEGTGEYLSAQIAPSSGLLQVSIMQPNFAHLDGGPVALAKLPAAWQAKFNAAAADSMVNVVIKVEVYETHFKTYIDGDLAFTSTEINAAAIASLKGMGYGLRSSSNARPSTYSLSYTAVYRTEFVADGETVGDEYHTAGATIQKTIADSAVKTDAQGAYLLRFVGWYTQAEGGRKVEIGCKDADGKLYAHFERIDLHTVTYDGDNGKAPTYQYYEDGAALVLPTAVPTKNGVQNDDVYIGYTFDKWQLNGADVPSGYTVTGDVTLTATYTEHNAYVVGYVTGVDGLTEPDAIVAENTAAPLPDLTRDGHRLDGWYTEADFANKYTNAPVTGAMTLYAKWIEQVTVTFVDGDTAVSTQTIDKGATATLPASRTKDGITLANKNTVAYAFNGWYVEGTKVTAATAFDADTTVTAVFDEIVRRNGYLVTQDENGDVYNINDYTAGFGNGFTIPDVEVKQGEYSFDLTLGQKAPSEYSVRIMILAQDENKVSFTGGDGNGVNMQGSLWVNFFTHSGQIALGRKIGGTSGSLAGYGPALANIKDCAYKTKYSNWTSGPITFRLKLVFGKNSVKFYIDDCLLIVYGDADITGETLYGVKPGTAPDALFKEWINFEGASAANVACKKDLPQGYKVGVHAWYDPSLVGNLCKISNISTTQYPAISYDGGGNVVSTETLAIGASITKTLADSAVKTDAQGAYLDRFVGWYSAATGGDRVETAAQAMSYADALGNVTLYAHYARIALHTVTYDANNGEENVKQYYEDGEALVPPTVAPIKNGTQSGEAYIGYTFDKWQLNGADIPSGYTVTGDVTLTAKYTENNAYLVSYVTNADGLTVENAIVAEGDAVTPPALTRDGYRLLGWYTDAQFANKYNGGGVTAATTLYAKWMSPVPVHFDTLGGSAVADVTYLDGAISVADPSRDNCYFTGWFYDEACTLSVDLSAPNIESEVTLYAGWRLPTANVKQNADGTYSSISDNVSLYAVHGIADSLCGEYTATITFLKGTAGSLGIAFRMSGSKDKANPASCMDVRYNFGSNLMQFWSDPGKTYVGGVVAAGMPAAFKTKYDSAASGSAVTLDFKLVLLKDKFTVYIDGDLIYSAPAAQYQLIGATVGYGYGVRLGGVPSSMKYSIAYKGIYEVELSAGGKTTVELMSSDKAITATIADSEVKTDAQGAYLDRFDGWYSAATGGDKVETAAQAGRYADASGKVTLYAQYVRVALHTVTYDKDNGEANIVQYYEDGKALVLPTVTPVKNGTQSGEAYIGYTFSKWQLNGADIPNGYAVTGDVTLTAKYTENNAYLVNFVTGVDGLTAENAIVAEGDAVALPALTRSGYRLDGWYTEADLTNKYTNAPVTGAMTLYAKWIEQVTVTFVDGNTAVSTQTIDKGATATLPANRTKATYNNPNQNVHTYTFNGWYVGSDKVTAATTFDADATVTAVFEETVRRNTIKFEYDDEGNLDTVKFDSGYANSKQGTDIPGVAVREGSFSHDVTFKYGAVPNYRIMFFVFNDGNVTFNGNGNQSEIFINLNMTNGNFVLGSKYHGAGGAASQPWSIAVEAMKDCSYKQKILAVRSSTDKTVTVNMKVVFKPGALKFYADDCLMFVYGYETAEYAGETLYGKVCTYENGVASARDNFKTCIDAPEGFGVGVQMWEALNGETVTLTNFAWQDTSAASAQSESAEQQTQPLTYIDNKEKETW